MKIKNIETKSNHDENSTFAVLRHANFRWLLIGTTFAFGAQWIQQVTLNWVVFDKTSSGTMLGALNLARAMATVGLAPLAGIVIDRMSKRKLMFFINSWLFTISLVLGIVLFFGYTKIWPLFVFSFLGGAGQAFNMPIRQIAAFILVPRHLAPNSVALIQTGWALMRSIGPSMAGFLMLWIGVAGNFLLMAGGYVLIALTILPLSFPSEKKTDPDTLAMSSTGNLREGLRYALSDRKIRAFLLMGWILPLFIIPIFTVLPPVYAKDVFKGGPQILGLLLSAIGVGGVIGGLFTASLWFIKRRGILLLVSLFLVGVSLTGFALAEKLWLALLFLGLSGFFEMIFLATNQTLLQISIPDQLRGRISGISALNAGLVPVGSIGAGVCTDLIGVQATTIALAVIAGMITILVFIFSPAIRDSRLES